MTKIFALLAFVALFTTTTIIPISGQSLNANGNPNAEGNSVPVELLVQFKAGANEFDIERALGKVNAEAL